MFLWYCLFFFFSSRRRHTRCALVTGVQTCALPILPAAFRDVKLKNSVPPKGPVFLQGETGQAAAGVASACGRLRQIDQCRQQASTIFEQLASEQYIEIDSVQRIEAGLKTKRIFEIGRAHVGTPVTNAQLVCRHLLKKKNK